MLNGLKTLTRAAAERVVGKEHRAELKAVADENDALQAELRRRDDELDERAEQLGRAADLLDEATGRIAELERIGREYFRVIEDVHREREEWKSMFFTQAIQHQGAQAVLARALSVADKRLRLLCTDLMNDDNEERREAAKELFAKLEAVPEPVELGKPAEFAAAMEALARSASPQTDAFAERQRIGGIDDCPPTAPSGVGVRPEQT